MKALAVAAAAAGALLAAAPAHAQQGLKGYYGGINFSQVSYEESGASTAHPTTLGLVFGRPVNPNLAIEGRFGIRASDDRINVGAVPVDVEVQYYAGGYAKGILPLAPVFSLYGLAGVTTAKVTASVGSLFVNGWETDFSYGLGAELAIGTTSSVTLEWLRMLDGSGYDLDTVSVGLNFRF
jgi:opacity protein-like surface antigen